MKINTNISTTFDFNMYDKFTVKDMQELLHSIFETLYALDDEAEYFQNIATGEVISIEDLKKTLSILSAFPCELGDSPVTFQPLTIH